MIEDKAKGARARIQGKAEVAGYHFGRNVLAFVGIALLLALVAACDDIPDYREWGRTINVGNPDNSSYPPRWTADGQQLVFRHQRRTRADIYVVKSDGAGLRRIFKESEKDKYSLPDISPDGSRIVYATTRHTFNKREEDKRLNGNVFRNWEIETAELKGSDKRRLTFDLVTQDHSPAWSPDGSRVAFVTTIDYLFLSLNVIAKDGSGYHPIVRGRRAYPVGTTGNQDVIRDPLGRDIYLGYREAIPGQEVIRDISLEYRPVWSPDGSKLAYIMDERVISGSGAPFRYVLYSVNADGSGLSRLFTADKILGAPGWSPDGTKLAIVSMDFGGGSQEHVGKLDIVSADGSGFLNVSGSRFLVSGSANFRDPGVSWSPDGSEILYVIYERIGNQLSKDGRVHIANVVSDSVRRLAWGSHASWSPDGSRVAVTSRDSDSYLSTMAPDGTDPRELVRVDSGGNLRASR